MRTRSRLATQPVRTAARSSGGYMTLASSAGINVGTGDFTANAWFRADFSVRGIFGKCPGGSVVPGWQLITLGNTLTAEYGSASQRSVATVGPVLGSWHMGTLTRIGTTVALYLDGALVGTNTNADNALTWDNSSALFVGTERTLALPVNGGGVCQAALWVGRALTAAELGNLYNSGIGVPYRSLGSLATSLALWAADGPEFTRDWVTGSYLTATGAIVAGPGPVG